MLCGNVAAVDILNDSSSFCIKISSCPSFTTNVMSSWFYHLERKRILYWIHNVSFLKTFNEEPGYNFSFSLCSKIVTLIFLAEKFIGGTRLKFLSKKLSGETLCNFFPIFPPKVLVYRGQIFGDTF